MPQGALHATYPMPPSPSEAIQEPLFAWEGRDKHGQSIRGEMNAGGASMVQAQLRRRGIFVTRIRQQRHLGRRGLRQRERAVFTRQLATMSRACIPLLQSLDLIARGQTNPTLMRIVQQLRAEVATGHDLSSAMARHPQSFPPVYRQLVAVGESAGVMDTTLDRLAVYEEKALALHQHIRSALMYPAVVMVVAMLVVAMILVVVVPTFEDVFVSFGAELPLPTRVVMSISEALVALWWQALGAIACTLCLVRLLVQRSAALQGALDGAALRLPVLGPLIAKALLARWTRTLSTLVGAGIPLVQALGSLASAAGNRVFAQATRQVQREVSTGRRLAQAMQDAQLFPPMVVQMAFIGEESGSLDSMMGKTADLFEAEVDAQVKGLSSLLEPVIIVVLGALIGGIVVALYLPIFQLGSIA